MKVKTLSDKQLELIISGLHCEINELPNNTDVEEKELRELISYLESSTENNPCRIIVQQLQEYYQALACYEANPETINKKVQTDLTEAMDELLG